jgi:hypothetical protein
MKPLPTPIMFYDESTIFLPIQSKNATRWCQNNFYQPLIIQHDNQSNSKSFIFCKEKLSFISLIFRTRSVRQEMHNYMFSLNVREKLSRKSRFSFRPFFEEKAFSVSVSLCQRRNSDWLTNLVLVRNADNVRRLAWHSLSLSFLSFICLSLSLFLLSFSLSLLLLSLFVSYQNPSLILNLTLSFCFFLLSPTLLQLSFSLLCLSIFVFLLYYFLHYSVCQLFSSSFRSFIYLLYLYLFLSFVVSFLYFYSSFV